MRTNWRWILELLLMAILLILCVDLVMAADLTGHVFPMVMLAIMVVSFGTHLARWFLWLTSDKNETF